MHKSLSFLFALSAVAAASDAQAQSQSEAQSDPMWYVRGHVQAAGLSDDNRSDVVVSAGQGQTLDARFDAGLGFGGAAGRTFGTRFRAEIEFAYLSAGIDRATVGPDFSVTEDNFASTGLGVNVLYHFSDDLAGRNGFSPYVGLGVVFLNEIDLDLEVASSGEQFSDLEGDSVAPQLIVGVNRSVTRSLSLGAEFRYLPAGGVDLANDSVTIRDLDYDATSLGLTLTYWFD